MRVGLYAHTEAVFDGAIARVPGHIGVLANELARQAGEMIIYLHSGSVVGNEDFALSEPYVTAVDLGPRRSFPSRTFQPKASLRGFDPVGHALDAMAVLGPTPLLPKIVHRSRHLPVALMIWGDYGAAVVNPAFSWWRNQAIFAYLRLYRYQQRRASRRAVSLIQNPALAHTVRSPTTSVVPFSSVVGACLPEMRPRPVWPESKGQTEPVRLLYSGRITHAKGLFEAIEAIRLLRDRGVSASLDLLGWEDPRDPTVDDLVARARALGVLDRLSFRDYTPPGPELFEQYANADIFVIPTYYDSLPRSMQEAMAMGLPTIATPVGGIGYHLRDRRTALLIPPRDPIALADAVAELIKDAILRDEVATAGQRWARSYTNETCCALVVDHLRAMIDAQVAG